MSILRKALAALLIRRRQGKYDAAYAAYETRPLDEPDARGDLASFLAASDASRP